MNKTIVAISAAIVPLVAVFLAYQIIESRMSPCEGIFQQSSVNLGIKLDIVKAKGAFVIGRQKKIQDLTEQSQLMAINLKSCCVVAGHTTSDFLRCKQGFDRYDTGINKIARSLIETEAARQQGNTAVANQELAEITERLKAVDASSREFTTQVRAIEQKASANVTQENNLNACCEIASNPDLRGLGRLVGDVPEGFEGRVAH